MVEYLKAKIHRATVTDANLKDQGTITIAAELLKAAGIKPFEKVSVYNLANGERFSTYAIEGTPGQICLNGAAAWKAKRHDRVIIAAYCWLTEAEAASFKPTLVYVGSDNE